MDTQSHPYIEIESDRHEQNIVDKRNIGYMLRPDTNSSAAKQTVLPEKDINDLLSDSRYNFIDLEQINDINVLAGIIQNLDLVICIESDLAYLAGSLNIPTYLILSAVPKHFWDLNYKDSTPWFPSLRLFRQEMTNDWSDVIKKVKERLIDV